MNNTYKKYIDEFMPSDEMRNYLKKQELTPYQLTSLIFNSPYSIDQKKNAFYSLLSQTLILMIYQMMKRLSIQI